MIFLNAYFKKKRRFFDPDVSQCEAQAGVGGLGVAGEAPTSWRENLSGPQEKDLQCSKARRRGLKPNGTFPHW